MYRVQSSSFSVGYVFYFARLLHFLVLSLIIFIYANNLMMWLLLHVLFNYFLFSMRSFLVISYLCSFISISQFYFIARQRVFISQNQIDLASLLSRLLQAEFVQVFNESPS